MRLVLIHASWLWGELLGYPGKSVGEAEAQRAGQLAAACAPGLVRMLIEGFDRSVLVLDRGHSWRRCPEVAELHDERHVHWPESAWRLLRPTLTTLGVLTLEPPEYGVGVQVPLGDSELSLAGKRAASRDLIATVARWWTQQPTDAQAEHLRIVSGRSALAYLADEAANIDLVRSIRHDGERGWTYAVAHPAEIRAELKCDPRLIADVRALASLRDIGDKTALKLVEAHGGSALVAVQTAARCPPDDKLQGTTAPQMKALRGAAASGGAAILRALAVHTVRSDVPIDIPLLLSAVPFVESGIQPGARIDATTAAARASDGASPLPNSADPGAADNAGSGVAPQGLTEVRALLDASRGAHVASNTAPDDDDAPPASGERRTVPQSSSTLDAAVCYLPADLAAAIVAAQAKVARVRKDSTNSYAKYRYANAEDMIDEARGALNAAGLAPIASWRFEPDVSLARSRSTDDGRTLTVGPIGRVVVGYLLVHASGAALRFETSTPVVPEKGKPEDKAEAAALTLNLAYSLRGLLLIPRGDEEGTAVDQRDDRQYQPPRGYPQQQQRRSS